MAGGGILVVYIVILYGMVSLLFLLFPFLHHLYTADRLGYSAILYCDFITR